MIDTPEVPVSREELEKFADWMELLALFEGEGEFSRDEATDVLIDSGLEGLEDREYLPGDAGYSDEGLMSPREKAGLFVEEVWAEIGSREQRLGSAYPFQTEPEYLLAVRGEDWREWAGYAVLLLADCAQVYPEVTSRIEPEEETGVIFEKVVEASVSGGVYRGAQRFGWPKEDGWPDPIDERIREFAQCFGLQVKTLEPTENWDKDRGLDVAARLDLGDRDAGSCYVLFQCAAGTNWKSKRGEPPLKDWDDILWWRGELLRGVAVPWMLPNRNDSTWNRKKVYRKFDGALVLDRMRLCYGHPDASLSDSAREGAVEWCEGRISELPRVG